MKNILRNMPFTSTMPQDVPLTPPTPPPDPDVPTLLARIEELEKVLQETWQRASRSNREHLSLMLRFNDAEQKIYALQAQLADKERQMSEQENRIPRILRRLFSRPA